MGSISFWHCGSNKPHATEFAIQNVRKHHPDAYYHLCSDGQNFEELRDIAKRYNCDFVYYDKMLGGPTQPYGYRKEGVLEFMNRFHAGMIRTNTSHMMMMEDDVLIVKPVTVEDYWEHACHNVQNDNLMHPSLIGVIKNHSFPPNVNRYGAGGGSIFNVESWKRSFNYNQMFVRESLQTIQSYYPTIGWIDCFMNVFYLINGKVYSINPHLTDTHNHHPGFDYDKFIANLDPEIEIVNNYKRLYFNE